MSIDQVVGSFYRREKCEVCGKTTERQKRFSGPTYAAMCAAGDAWTQPLRHKKCEYLPTPTEGATP